MSGAWRSFRKSVVDPVREGLGLKSPKLPGEPQVPQLDEAKERLTEFDRVRRRRGVLANIFAGNRSGDSGTVSTKALLGE